MLRITTDLQDRLVIRQLGTVKHISQDIFNSVIKTCIKFYDNNAELKRMNNENFVKQNLGVPIENAEVYIRIKSTRTSSPVMKRIQFSLMLTSGCTVPKVQGLSLREIVMSFE